MEILWFGISGILGGILGGMGMGGGTILIPLLGIFHGVSQHVAQAVNLLSFVPMAVVALVIHFKNKLVNWKIVWIIISSGVATCVAGCFIAKAIDGEILARLFGGFLIILSILQFVEGVKRIKKK